MESHHYPPNVWSNRLKCFSFVFAKMLYGINAENKDSECKAVKSLT